MAGRAHQTLAWALTAILLIGGADRAAGEEPPALADLVARKALPPLAARLPQTPRLTKPDWPGWSPGRYGGRLRMLVRGGRDARNLIVFGYARLVGYDHARRLQPDLVERVEVKEGRSFTFKLRRGHRWSDGAPFTAEDFRYWWEDVANNETLSPLGPPRVLLVDGAPPSVDIKDEITVRYRWDKPNPDFLPALAAARPLQIYRPAHYLRQIHADHVNEDALAAAVAQFGGEDWVKLHQRLAEPYSVRAPGVPTLQPWRLVNAPPAERLRAERNPFYHAVDPEGRQLPYIDEVILIRTQPDLIATKAAAGEADLAAIGLSFRDAALLKAAEQRKPITLRLWDGGRGSQLALYPNLNTRDEMWRILLRDVRFRRALSLAIDRQEINQVIYQGLAVTGNNGLLPGSPLYDADQRAAWASFDPDQAEALLTEIGLRARDAEGRRLLNDGRPMQLVVATGETDPAEADVLQVIASHWRALGIELLVRPAGRMLFRSRATSGESIASVFYGIANGVADADMSPAEWAPTSRGHLSWPLWGWHFETGGRSGEAPDVVEARKLLTLYRQWRATSEPAVREAAWREILALHADQLFTIGLTGSVPQPIVANAKLRNLPDRAVWAWAPTAYFGAYRPDSFWFAE